MRRTGNDTLVPSDGKFSDLLTAMKRAAAALRDHQLEFALAGGLAVYARGGPETDHDVDFLIRKDDAERALAEAQANQDVLGAYRVLRDAFETDVRPLLAEARRRMGLDPDPIAAFHRSGYAGLTLASLAEGEYRELTAREVEQLRRTAQPPA